MAQITLRSSKNSPLTIKEVDDNFSNLNVEVGQKLSETLYTGAEILSRLLTVDGIGSGLDADKLDGLSASVIASPNTIVARNASGIIQGTIENGVVTTTTYTDPSWLSLSPSKVGLGNVTNESKATMFTNAALTGIPTAPTASAGTNTTQIATTAFVVNNAIPAGGIIIWSGSSSSIPGGWTLCNGSNGTPDLRNRFVVGAGSLYSVGATGGSADSVVVSHTHSITDPGHVHVQQNNGPDVDTGSLATGNQTSGTQYGSQSTVQSSVSTVSATTGLSLASAGVSGTNANLPPYYALCYIMKL